MIKQIILKEVRGITKLFNFNKGLNIISGDNGTGKSTIISSIIDGLRGEKISVKEGVMSLETSDGIIERKKNKLIGSPKLDIDLCIPGFLMGKGKIIKGVNSSMGDRRDMINNLLKINKNKYLLEHGIDFNTDGLLSELKDKESKADALTDLLLERESLTIPVMKKPRKVKLVTSTENRIIKGNKDELDNLKNRLENNLARIINPSTVLDKPKEVILKDRKIIKEGNEDLIKKMKDELEQIKQEGINISSVCDKCGQDIKDSKLYKDKLRDKYINLKKKLDGIKVIKTEIQESNIDEYTKYQNELNEYNKKLEKNKILKENNEKILEENKIIQKQISDFVLIEDKVIKGNKGNEDKYKEYQIRLNDYIANETAIKNREDDINDLKEKIKSLSTGDIKEKINKYKEVELSFIESIKDKLVLGDIEFVFYKRTKSSNSLSEYIKTFDIKYKGKSYKECSGGEQVIIDIIISTLFIKDLGIIDTLLIDNAEISDTNLKYVLDKYCKGLQIITTRIGKDDLILKSNLG